MTVSTSTQREFTVGEIVKRAYQLAGLVHIAQQIDPDRLSLGKDLLDSIVDELATVGVTARAGTFELVSLVDGQATYSLAPETQDVIDDAMYVPAGSDPDGSGNETVVVPIDRGEWQRLSSKGSRGRPYMYFPDRVATVIGVRLWPVPNETGAQIRFQVHRRLADCNDERATVDLERHWSGYLTYELAQRLATSQSLSGQKVSLLAQMAEKLKRESVRFAKERPPQQGWLSHASPWRRV